MFKEIFEEVIQIELDGLSHVKSKISDSVEDIVNLIAKSAGRVVVCGMGKSGHVGKKIFATLVSTGTPSMFLHPAEAFHGDLGMVQPNDIFIAISNSGETEEILKLIPYLQDNGNVLISLTGNPDSTLAQSSKFHIDVGVEREACPHQLAPTASTTATLAMGDALAVALMGARNFLPENFARFHPGGALGQKLLGRVVHFMKPAICIDINADFKDVLKGISNSGSGIICVKDIDSVVGVITDGDIRRCLSSFDLGKVVDMSASSIYSKNPRTINENIRCIDADEIMRNSGVNSLLVITADGKPFIYQNLNRG
jgi:arabinose-5-phosphate isomerase